MKIHFSKLRSGNSQLIILFLFCIVSRLYTTIYYIADPDSLRFALAIQEYDLVKLQPHFPGYPVFCFVAKLLTMLCGKFSLAFSIIGGISTFIIIWSLLQINKLLKLEIHPILITILLFFNPMIWLMGNRYMPDLMGLSLCLLAFYFFIQSYISTHKISVVLFIATIGLLAGTRLSYLPLLIIPAIYSLLFFPYKKLQLLIGIIAILIWFVPMLIYTGWNNLIEVATAQSSGHFYEWGGTVISEPNYLQRFYALIRNITADGMGAYWIGRNYLTLVPMLVVLVSVPFAILYVKLAGRPKTEVGSYFGLRSSDPRLYGLIVSSFIVYAVWIFFYQNILYQSRHVLPLVIVCVFLVALGLTQLIKKKRFIIIPVILVLLIQMGITFKLAMQQQSPTAIAQTSAYLKNVANDSTLIITHPLMQNYFEHFGVKAHYMHSADSSRQAYKNYNHLIFIGNNTTLADSFIEKKIFHHNPYINRVWPTIKIQLE